MEAARAMTEARLQALIPQSGRLEEAMRYSLLAGGKRLRPLLTLAFCRVCGGEPADALDAACGVEMLHTYSLIHDDMPCMDNDALRRGKPTSHVVYGEWLALLAGDALQAEAFRVLLDSALPARAKARAAAILARAAGRLGICGGQYLDLAGEGNTLSPGEIREMYALKTAALFEAACMIGAVSAGAPEEKVEAAKRFGGLLGLAFQIRDDLLDLSSSDAVLGKPVGSDEKNGKATLAALLGPEKAARVMEENSQAALQLLQEQFDGDEFLVWLVEALLRREN